MLNIIEKGQTFDLTIASKQTTSGQFYFGAGWDNPNGPVDLDIVAAVLVGGKLVKASDFVYFGNRTAPGVQLSEDNQTGEGDGDDEDIVIDTMLLPADCDKVVIGLFAYAGADLSNAPNTHFRVCDGTEETSEQIGDVTINADAVAGDTAVIAFELIRTATGWVLENKSTFQQLGAGSGGIQKFGAQFQA